MDRLEELKNKYQSVLRFLEQRGARLHNLHVQDNKLFVKASVPTPDMKNLVWDQIKLVDPGLADVAADIIVDESMAPPPPAEDTYTVQPGDTLSKISKKFYGDANQYMRIFEANKDQLDDPNKIKVGQVLKIPAA